MNILQRTRPVLSASLLALGFVAGGAGVANAQQIQISGNLTNISGTVQTGSSTSAGGNTAQATLEFSVPTDAFGSDADTLARSPNPVDFTTSLTGTIGGGLVTTLDAENNFATGSNVADFLLGTSGPVTFDTASIKTSLTPESPVVDPTASVSNPTFSASQHTLSTLTGGTLNLSGSNPSLANLNIDAQLTDGSGTITATGSTGATAVPTPSGYAMLLFTSIAAAGMGFFARRRQNKNLGAA